MSESSAAGQWLPGASVEWTVTVVNPDHAGTTASDPALVTLTDAELVARSVAGSTAAFDVLVRRHQRVIYKLCVRFVHNHEDASDLAQDVFVRAWRGLAGFKGGSAVSTWLYRIAVNTCLNHRALKRPSLGPIVDPDVIEDVHGERPGTALLRRERAAAVRKAISELPTRQRATLVLRVYHELSHQEIASILGSSVGAVKANVFHALGNLRKILESRP